MELSTPTALRSPKIEVKIIAAFLTAFLAVSLVGVATYVNANNLLNRNKLVVHTYQVIGRIDDVFNNLDEIESGARGFLLTGKQDYLQPYQAGLGAVGAHINELRRMTADNPLQQRNIDRLQSLANRVIDRVHRQVITHQLTPAAANLPAAEEKELMDQVRFTTAEMKGVETQLLERRDQLSAESAHRTITNFGLLLMLAVLLLIAFYYFIRHDLAERRRNDEALRASEQKVRAVMDSAPDAMLITDDKGLIQMANLQAKNLFGYSREELLDRDLSSLLVGRTVCAEEAEEENESAGRLSGDAAFREMRSMAAKFDGVRKDGTSFPLDLSRSPLEIGDEHLLISAIRDRTEREHAEEALRKFSLDLARSNAELERFAYVASHDLQEPLRMVSSYTQLLAKRYRGKLDANADEFINYAVDGASRMQKLINDLLALSRVGTQAKPSEPVDTGAVLSRVLSDLGPAIEGAGATVVPPGEMPTVLADGTQIGQLFQNLIGNALKFRGTEPPRIEVRVAPADDAGFWQFAFQDNGIGIEPQYFERIFVIFQRLHTKESYPGTGIGLAICKKIVERHGGRLWVDSAVGKGTTFSFTLPMVSVS